MPPWFWLLIYSLAIVVVSLVGGWVPLLIRLTHRRMQVAISFVSGVMLGVAVMHLLPHAVYEAQRGMPGASHAASSVFVWLLGGVLAMFFVERFFCFHHHDAPHAEAGHDAPADFGCHGGEHAHKLSWSGAAVGLTLHSLIEGVALAAAVAAEPRYGGAMPLVGLSTFLVIFLHKPFDALTLGTLMAHGGWSPRARHVVNALFSLAVPASVVLFYFGAEKAFANGAVFLAPALAFAAGTFLCIAMSDLLPELHFHQHDRLLLSAALLLGLAVAWLSSIVEHGGHIHIAPPAKSTTYHQAATAGRGIKNSELPDSERAFVRTHHRATPPEAPGR